MVNIHHAAITFEISQYEGADGKPNTVDNIAYITNAYFKPQDGYLVANTQVSFHTDIYISQIEPLADNGGFAQDIRMIFTLSEAGVNETATNTATVNVAGSFNGAGGGASYSKASATGRTFSSKVVTNEAKYNLNLGKSSYPYYSIERPKSNLFNVINATKTNLFRKYLINITDDNFLNN